MTRRSWQPARGLTEQEHLQLFRRLWQWRLDHPGAMPAHLWEELRQLLDWLWMQYPMSRERIRHHRWAHVSQGLKRKGVLKAAYKYAADACRGTAAEAGEHMMKKDFDAIERRYGRRRPRSS